MFLHNSFHNKLVPIHGIKEKPREGVPNLSDYLPDVTFGAESHA